jgi:hypothetical protein
MNKLNQYIKLDNVVTVSNCLLEEINPKVFIFNTDKGAYCMDFAELSDTAKLNYTFNGLFATGYNVVTSGNKDLIKFTFDDNLKLDFKYCESYRQIDYNPLNELIYELQTINSNFDELLKAKGVEM